MLLIINSMISEGEGWFDTAKREPLSVYFRVNVVIGTIAIVKHSKPIINNICGRQLTDAELDH